MSPLVSGKKFGILSSLHSAGSDTRSSAYTVHRGMLEMYTESDNHHKKTCDIPFHFSATCACLKTVTGRSLLPTGCIFSHMQGANMK